MGSSGIFLQSIAPDTERAHWDTLSKSLKELKSNDQATCDANSAGSAAFITLFILAPLT